LFSGIIARSDWFPAGCRDGAERAALADVINAREKDRERVKQTYVDTYTVKERSVRQWEELRFI